MASRVQLSGPQEAEKYVLHMVRLVNWVNYPNLKIDPTQDSLSVWIGSPCSEWLNHLFQGEGNTVSLLWCLDCSQNIFKDVPC